MIKDALKNQHIRTGWPKIAKMCIVKMPLSAQNKKKGERRKVRKEGGIESTQCVASKSMKEWEGNEG